MLNTCMTIAPVLDILERNKYEESKEIKMSKEVEITSQMSQN